MKRLRYAFKILSSILLSATVTFNCSFIRNVVNAAATNITEGSSQNTSDITVSGAWAPSPELDLTYDVDNLSYIVDIEGTVIPTANGFLTITNNSVLSGIQVKVAKFTWSNDANKDDKDDVKGIKQVTLTTLTSDTDSGTDTLIALGLAPDSAKTGWIGTTPTTIVWASSGIGNGSEAAVGTIAKKTQSGSAPQVALKISEQSKAKNVPSPSFDTNHVVQLQFNAVNS